MNEEMSVKLDELLSDISKFSNWFDFYKIPPASGCADYLPDLPGLYLVVGTFGEDELTSFEQVFYVGVSTTSIRTRWRNHHKIPVFEAINLAVKQARPDMSYKSFLVIHTWVNPFASPEYLLWLERKLIERIKPRCNNLTTGKNRDSEIIETTVIKLPYSNSG